MSSFAIASITKPTRAVSSAGSKFACWTDSVQSQQARSQNGRYQLQGVVVSVEEPEHSVVVKHEEIPGFMSAMTMPYEVADERVLDRLSPGEQIRTDVVVNGANMRLENIQVINK